MDNTLQTLATSHSVDGSESHTAPGEYRSAPSPAELKSWGPLFENIARRGLVDKEIDNTLRLVEYAEPRVQPLCLTYDLLLAVKYMLAGKAYDATLTKNMAPIEEWQAIALRHAASVLRSIGEETEANFLSGLANLDQLPEVTQK
jgi:hypothetical protein